MCTGLRSNSIARSDCFIASVTRYTTVGAASVGFTVGFSVVYRFTFEGSYLGFSLTCYRCLASWRIGISGMNLFFCYGVVVAI